MITKKRIKLYCCEDPCLIENYDKAMADDTQVWDCHHRLEVQGDKILSREELKEQGLYWNRPACELIFLTPSEHKKLHNTGKHLSEEWCEKISAAKQNISEETRRKLSEARKGKIPWNKGKTGIYSEETKQKISNTLKENIPWNKGKKMSEAYKESCKKGWITRKKKRKSRK